MRQGAGKIVNHRIGEWMGPYLVDSFELHKKLVHVRNEKREGYTLNYYQVKKYVESDTLSGTFMMELNSHLDQLSFSCYYPRNNGSYDSTYPTEVLSNQNPRVTSPEMKAAIAK